MLIVPGSILLLSYLPTMRAKKVYPAEVVTVPDNTHELPDTLIIDGAQGEYFKPNKQVITPAVMRTLARGIKQGQGLGYQDLVQRRGAPFTRAEYLSIRAEMLDGGLWQWRGRDNRSGLELTQKGSRVFEFWHKVLCNESPPTTGEFRHALRNLPLANERTKQRSANMNSLKERWLS